MVHGACSSAGCYSMTDEAAGEIFALARDAFKGGQRSFQIQAFPFRMTPENIAKHRGDPNMDFWKDAQGRLRPFRGHPACRPRSTSATGTTSSTPMPAARPFNATGASARPIRCPSRSPRRSPPKQAADDQKIAGDRRQARRRRRAARGAEAEGRRGAGRRGRQGRRSAAREADRGRAPARTRQEGAGGDADTGGDARRRRRPPRRRPIVGAGAARPSRRPTPWSRPMRRRRAGAQAAPAAVIAPASPVDPAPAAGRDGRRGRAHGRQGRRPRVPVARGSAGDGRRHRRSCRRRSDRRD